MNVYVTGNKGFIAKNLIRLLNSKKINCVHALEDEYDITRLKNKSDYDYFKLMLKNNEVDVLVHNAAIVGTDVCALNQEKTFDVNCQATANIAKICSELNIPILYLGTTVVYNTSKYQNEPITESSEILPKTFYAKTKMYGEIIINDICKNSGYLILRPLFCYGGIGDMNSLIAKSIYNYLMDKRIIKIFLDPDFKKDYMHVSDFASAIAISIEKGLVKSNLSFNVSRNDPINTLSIMNVIDYFSQGNDKISSYIQWIPETDYLGNHIVDNSAFIEATEGSWKPTINLDKGIEMSYYDIKTSLSYSNANYNPLQYLNYIEDNKIDPTKFYPKD